MEKIQVVLTNHAMMDCIPLRFGIVLNNRHCSLEAALDDEGTSKQKPIEQSNGNRHFVGNLIQNNQIILSNARFVLAKKKKHEYSTAVINVMLKEFGLASRSVSDLIRSFRESGDLTPEEIKNELHPLYTNDGIKDEQQIFKALVDMDVADAKEDFKIKISEVNKKYEEELIKRKEIEDRYKDLEEKMKSSDVQNDVQYKGETIDVSPIATLTNVIVGTRTNYSGKVIRCTTLEFEEPIPNRVMDEWADKDGKKTTLAKSLVGEKVRTTVWKPETFSSLNWFRNIYKVEV
jgi:hypothetical protein